MVAVKQNGFHKNRDVNGIYKHKHDNCNGHSIKTTDTGKDDFWESFEETPLALAVFTYICYAVVFLIGHIRDFLQSIALLGNNATEPKVPGFVPLYNTWESFYTRHIYRRVSDCFCCPVGGVPGATVDIIERETADHGWNYTDSFTFFGQRVPFASS